MEIFTTLLLLISLFFIFLQDFKERKVHVFLLCISISCFGWLHYLQAPYIFVYNMLFNCFLLTLTITVLYFYTKYILRKKFNDGIGRGDLLFFMAIAIGFPTYTFLILFVSSLIFSLVVFQIIKKHQKTTLIPLAGLQALFLLALISMNSYFNFSNLYLI